MVSTTIRTIPKLLKPLIAEFHNISSSLSIHQVLHIWRFFIICLTCMFISYCPCINFENLSHLHLYLGLYFYSVHQSTSTDYEICAQVRIRYFRQSQYDDQSWKRSVDFKMNLWGHRLSQNPNQKFQRFLPWKFTTSRLIQKESLCSFCKKIDSLLY